jgi:SAM-dependent methyltransferase
MWNERYSQPGFAYGTEPNEFLAAAAGRIPAGPVLSLGEGEGRNAAYLAGLGHRVVAVDQSAVGLAKARRLAADRGLTVETVCADLDGFPIEPGAWAGVVTIFCHLPRRVRAPLYGAAVRGLQPGGVLVLEAYTPKQLGRDSRAVIPFTLSVAIFMTGLGRERVPWLPWVVGAAGEADFDPTGHCMPHPTAATGRPFRSARIRWQQIRRRPGRAGRPGWITMARAPLPTTPAA